MKRANHVRFGEDHITVFDFFNSIPFLDRTGDMYRMLGEHIRKAMDEYACKKVVEQKWISVEDNLPSSNTMVLVWQDNLSDKTSSRLQKANHLMQGVFVIYPATNRVIYKESEGYKNYDLEGDMCQITHWMPIPQPPNQ